MRIEPQYQQFFTRFAAMLRHRSNRSDGQRMVTTQQDRNLSLMQAGMDRLVNVAIPEHHLFEMTPAIHRSLQRIGRTANIAAITNLQAMLLQRLLQTGYTQGFGSHRSTPAASADIGRSANQADLGHANSFNS